jgi:GNAT superfamily N-acetyltransferase
MSNERLHRPRLISADDILNEFESGEAELDNWLKNRALKNNLSGASRCFVVCAGKKVVGYYALSAGTISHEAAPKSMRRNMPDPLPVMLLGRLAVDRHRHNQGIGRALIRDAMMRVVTIAADTGVFAVLVHAISEPARQFYLSQGFVSSPIQSRTLLMTLETVRSILAED